MTTKPSNTSKTKMITLRCPTDLHEQLNEHIQENKTAWIIDAIEKKLNSQLNDKQNLTTTSNHFEINRNSKVKYREYHTPKGIFFSQTEAAKAHNIARRTMSDRVRSSDERYYAVTYDGEVIGKGDHIHK